MVYPDDLVFNPMWAIEGGVAVSEVEGAVSTAYRTYHLSRSLFPRFVHYYFRSEQALAQYRLMVRGITTFDRSITRADFEAMPTPVPPIEEQRAIADYLDTETVRIDAFITKKHRMIELLEERSQSSVAERLGSLDGRVAHLSHVADIYSGSGFPLSYQGNDVGDYPFFKVGDLASAKDGRWIDSAPNWIDQATARSLGCRLAPVGSVLFPKVGAALLGNRRRITRVMAAFDNNLMAVTSSILEPRYLRYILTLVDLGEWANPGPVPSVNEGTVGSLPVKIPSSVVQERVADELDTILNAHGGLASLHELEVRLLGERRQALITSAVTGELTVSGVVV